MRVLIAITAGVLFGLGLIAGGMTDPSKVQGFLDLFGQWDPSLAFVMGGALVVGIAGFALARRQKVSWTGDAIDVPQSKVINARLLIGGALFGVGWGLGGMCPGPAVTALGAAFAPAAWFVVAMLLGMWLHDRFVGPSAGALRRRRRRSRLGRHGRGHSAAAFLNSPSAAVTFRQG